MDEDEDEPAEAYGLVCPFWTDTDAYTDRDRDMFTAGFEFADLLREFRYGTEALERPIHRENESRARLAAARFGRRVEVGPHAVDDDPYGAWSWLRLEAR